MKNASRALSLLLSLVMLFSMLPTNALAWKTKTHIYSSNLLLDENRHEGWQIPITLNDGRTLFFDMPQEYRDALITYPEMFRAGSMGPDVYPDMLTGQSWIHPDDVTLGITSGDWLKVLADAANALPKDSDRRKRAIAFTLGYMLHYCGDMFGHDFINIFAGGSFPSVATLADPGPRGIVLRHMATENYMDAAIDGSYKTDDRTLVYAPVDFLLNSMYYRGHASNGASDILRRFSNLPPQCSYLINLRNTLYQAAENMRKDYNPASVTAVAYLDRWIADIDDATYTLIMTFDNIGQRWARGTDGDVTVIQEELRKWLHNYGRYATPIPDVAFIPGNILDTILSYVKKIVPDFLLYFPNKWNEFLDYLTNSAIEYVMRAYVDMTPEELMDELKDPETLLNNSTDGLYNDMLAALGTFGHDAVGEGNAASKQTLAAFHNTITMMKLVLIGPSNYEILVHQLSGKAEHAYQPAEGQIKASGLNLRIQTSSDWRAGTDDNVYAVIEVREPNGSVRQFERLLDISGYDDFERRDLDTYEVPLGGLYCLSDIVSVSLQKRYREIADDWRLDTVDVIPMNGEVPLFGCDENSNDIGHHFDVYHTFTEKNEKRLLGNFSDLPTDLANIAASYKTEFSTVDCYKESRQEK